MSTDKTKTDSEETVPSNEITINEVHLRHSTAPGEGQLLKGCGFERIGESDDYRFVDKEQKVLKDKVKSGETFDFKFDDKRRWQITVHFSRNEERAHGDWTLLDSDSDAEEEGTFHAQAGGGLPEETASSAYA